MPKHKQIISTLFLIIMLLTTACGDSKCTGECCMEVAKKFEELCGGDDFTHACKNGYEATAKEQECIADAKTCDDWTNCTGY